MSSSQAAEDHSKEPHWTSFRPSRLEESWSILQKGSVVQDVLSHFIVNSWCTLQARVLALKKIYPDYEDNAPTMSESAFNRMTYPRWLQPTNYNQDRVQISHLRPISEPPSPVSTRPSSPERRSRPGSPGARWLWHWRRHRLSLYSQVDLQCEQWWQCKPWLRGRAWRPWAWTELIWT